MTNCKNCNKLKLKVKEVEISIICGDFKILKKLKFCDRCVKKLESKTFEDIIKMIMGCCI